MEKAVIEERLAKVEKTLKLILEWTLDNSNPNLLKELRKQHAERMEVDRLFFVEEDFEDFADDIGGDTEVKSEREAFQEPHFDNDDESFAGEDDYHRDSSPGIENRPSFEANVVNKVHGSTSRQGEVIIDKLKMTPVVRLFRIPTTSIGGSLSTEDKQKESNLLQTQTLKKPNRGGWTCGVCHAVFPSYRALVNHRGEKMHYKFRVKCEECGEILRSRPDLLKHQREIHSRQTIKLEPGISTGRPTTRNMSTNVSSLSTKSKGMGNWICGVCNNVFPTQRALITHRQKEMHYKQRFKVNRDGGRQVKRRVPNGGPSTSKTYAVYKVGSNWKCLTCSKLLPTARSLLAHKKTFGHHDRYIKCDQCSEILPNRSKYISHKLDKHNWVELSSRGGPSTSKTYAVNKVGSDWKCLVCNKLFPTVRSLLAHKKTFGHHDKYIKCDQCSEILPNRSKYTRHKRDKHNWVEPSPIWKGANSQSESQPTQTCAPEPEQEDANQSESESTQTCAPKPDQQDDHDGDKDLHTLHPRGCYSRYQRKREVKPFSVQKVGSGWKCLACNKLLPTVRSLLAHKCDQCSEVPPNQNKHTTRHGDPSSNWKDANQSSQSQPTETCSPGPERGDPDQPSEFDSTQTCIPKTPEQQSDHDGDIGDDNVTTPRPRRRRGDSRRQKKRVSNPYSVQRVGSDWKCLVCNKLLPTLSSLLAHKKKFKHQNVNIKCDQCSEVLPNRSKYVSHKLDKHNWVELSSRGGPSTSKTFAVHKVGSNWKCLVCNKLLPTVTLLLAHKKTFGHHDKHIKCDQCSEILPNRANYLRHKRDRHNWVEPSPKWKSANQRNDSQPNQTFVLKSEQEDANQQSGSESTQTYDRIAESVKKKSTTGSPCTCVICSDRRKNDDSNKTLPKEFSCNKCNSVFDSIAALKAHKQEEKHYTSIHELRHPDMTGPGWHKCSDCNYTCYKRANYIRHQTKHSQERPYMCSTCGESFKSEITFQSHSFVHTGEPRPFVCKYCGSGFLSALYLRLHEKRHEGTMEKLCPHCNLKFVNLKMHIDSVHKKVRRYNCHLCDHKFKRCCHLKRHVATHNNPNRRVKGYHIERPLPVRIGKKTVLRMCEPEEVQEAPSLTSGDVDIPTGTSIEASSERETSRMEVIEQTDQVAADEVTVKLDF